MPDPNNPLSYIGASNDPTLGNRVKQSQQSTLDLQRGLSQIAAKGQNARQLAGINNLAQAKREGMQYGLNPNSPTFAADLAERRGDIHDTSRSNILSNRATAAGIAADSLGLKPPPGKPISIAQAVNPNALQTMGISNKILASAAQGSDVRVLEDTNRDKIKEVQHISKEGDPIAGKQRTTEIENIKKQKDKVPVRGLTRVEEDNLMLSLIHI